MASSSKPRKTFTKGKSELSGRKSQLLTGCKSQIQARPKSQVIAAEPIDEISPNVQPEVPKFTLNNDLEIPIIGLGTNKLISKCKDLVGDAIKLGYRHIDCAEINGNEKEIGEAIREYIKKGVIRRDEMFITSKVWNTHHTPQLLRRACEGSLRTMGLTYFDCYVMHSPMAFKEGDIPYPKDEDGKIIFSDVDLLQTWRAMEKLVQNGLVKCLGLANCNIRQLNQLLEKVHIKPALLYVECHPYMNQQILIDYCAANDIAVAATLCFGSPSHIYRAFNKIPLLQNPKIQEIAATNKRTAAEVLFLRYQIQRGNIVIPSAVKRTQLRDNILTVTFKLTPAAMGEIDELDTGTRIITFDNCKGHPNHPFEKDIF